MQHLNAKAGYPNSKKGLKMKYEQSLIQKKRNKNNMLIVVYSLFTTILSIIKSH